VTLPYVASPFAPRRRITREVRVGDVGIGGANPIRVQSMTTTPTLDTRATADQAERLADAGCEIVRITAPSIRDAENLAAIRAEFERRRVRVPLVADIHFTPNAALEAALHVEKVRVNPGNYADKKRFEARDYTEAEYREEVGHVQQRFRPLVRRLKQLGRALRIGTNHGSLSDRIMNRFGDTPLGMVESALEFLSVCEDEAYYDVVFSMKASNPQVAIHAYRLLAARLAEREAVRGRDPWQTPSYPFHVGVTEAGDGEDGRVKSAIGIGALLEDGLGDTIRVSLTEDPVKEIPVARALAARYDARWAAIAGPNALAAEREAAALGAAAAASDPEVPFTPDPYAHARRATRCAHGFGASEPVRVIAALGPAPRDVDAAADAIVRELARLGELACEGLALEARDAAEIARAKALGAALEKRGVALPLAIELPASAVSLARDALRSSTNVPPRFVITVRPGELPPAELAGAEWHLRADGDALSELLERALANGARPAAISVTSALPTHAVRLVAARLAALGHADVPLVLRHASDPFAGEEAALLAAATDLGAPLCDGLGDAVVLGGFGALSRDVAIAYRILQGARQRTSWTEFISCPSCGRTLFDLEETTARIKARTAHLPGLKIAVMGCIVNGPGEMADADFGYVGSGVGRVNLYVGHECVVRNVPEAEAPERLVALIKEQGRWQEAR
jgi:(E)-4-hydroxy-3-methylbut-2-enyl-diphosphate synthase